MGDALFLTTFRGENHHLSARGISIAAPGGEAPSRFALEGFVRVIRLRIRRTTLQYLTISHDIPGRYLVKYVKRPFPFLNDPSTVLRA